MYLLLPLKAYNTFEKSKLKSRQRNLLIFLNSLALNPFHIQKWFNDSEKLIFSKHFIDMKTKGRTILINCVQYIFYNNSYTFS